MRAKNERERIYVYLLDVLHNPVAGDGLGALEGEAKSTVEEKLGESTVGTGNSEENGVVVLLLEAVVLKEDTTVRVDVRPGVLGLTVLEENVGHNLVDSRHNVEELVIRHELKSKSALGSVTGVSLTENGVTVAGDDTARVEGIPSELADGVLVHGLALLVEVGLKVKDPAENLLVGKTVERASEGVEATGDGKVRVTQGGADQVSGVGTGVTTLVVTVDHKVETHELVELGVRVAKHAAEVGRVIEGRVVLGDLAVVVGATVDESGNLGELGDHVEDILVCGLPVLSLVHALSVLLGEDRLGLESSHGSGELGHGVHGLGEGADEGLDVVRELGTGVELVREGLGLVGSGALAGHEEPEEGLRARLATLLAAGRGELLLEVRDGTATEADTLLGVEERGLPDHALDTTGTTNGLLDGDLTEALGAVLSLELLELLLLLGDDLEELLLEGGGGEATGRHKTDR